MKNLSRTVIVAITSLALVALTPLAASSAEVTASSSSPPDALTSLNFFRNLSAVSAASAPSAANNSAAADAACYMVKNQVAEHGVNPTTSCHPGDQARNDAASIEAAVGVVSFSYNASKSPQQHVYDLISAPFHGVSMLNPGLVNTSIGYYQDPAKGSALVMRVLDNANTYGSTSGVFSYPENGTITPLTTFNGNEVPDPLGHCGYSAPTGAPIYAWMPANVTSSSATFRSGSTNLEFCLLDTNNFNIPGDPGNTSAGKSTLSSYKAVIILPRQPLKSGTSYTYRVNANNSAYTTGDKTFSTYATAPEAVQNAAVISANKQLTVNWQAPNNDGGSTITGYRVTLQPGNQVVNVNGNTFSTVFSNLDNQVTYTVSINAINNFGTSPTVSLSAKPSAVPGYWIVDRNGAVRNFGAALNHGSMAGRTLNAPIVASAPTPSGKGYWLLGEDGGIFSFGDAQFYGSTGGMKLNAPVVGMASTPSGKGYWLVAKDGGIFSYGDAQFFGSTGSLKLNKPVVDMSVTPSGKGYRFVATDGGVFNFGDAQFFGSTGSLKLNKPVFSLASSPTGNGYWLVAEDGGIFAFGDSRFYGSLPGIPNAGDGVRIRATANGYYILGKTGRIFAFGDAVPAGEAPGTTPVDLMLLP